MPLSYETRQAQLKQELAREQKRNQAFREVLNALEAEQAQVARDLRTRQWEYARLDSAWQGLRRELLQRSAESSELQRQIDSLDTQMARRKSVDPGNIATKQRQRDDLQRRLRLLQQEIDAGVYEN